MAKNLKKFKVIVEIPSYPRVKEGEIVYGEKSKYVKDCYNLIFNDNKILTVMKRFLEEVEE